MTDTTTVQNTPPPSAPPPAAPPAQTEVPVTPVVNQPQTPLGNQAPPKPEGQESNKSSQISRREALQNAFSRAKEAQEEAVKTAAEKPAQRQVADDKSSDKSRQTATSDDKPERSPQHREQGRFARDPNKPLPEPGQQQPGQQQRQPLPENAPFREPPPRFDERARADWAAAPESVRGAVDRMAREFQGAYERYRGDHEVMETLRPYHDLAQKQGTSIERAFTNYYQMEQKLREDVVGGLDILVQNLRLKAPNGQPITLRDVAHHILTMTPEQHQLTAQRNQVTAADMRIGQLHQMVEKLTQGFSQMQFQQRFNDQRAAVDEFAAKHPRFKELGNLIKEEIDHGYSLEVAYQRAERLAGPPTQAAQTRNASAQTRRTSISGAPDGNGKNTVPSRPSDGQRSANGEQKHPSRREALQRAFRRASNGV